MIERHLIDTNCNDCKHLIRSFVGRQKHEDFHYECQKRLFDIHRLKLLSKYEKHLKKGNKEKAKLIFKEVKSMNFVYDGGKASLFYGYCSIKNKKKEFSFIPNTVMEENFNCFEHRRL